MNNRFKIIMCIIIVMVLFSLLAVGCEPTNPPSDGGEPTEKPAFSKENVKILAIGNSFSDNAVKYLYPILKAFGAENVVVGNLYIGGCTLRTHLTCATKNLAAYAYYKNNSGSFAVTSDTTMLDGIKDEEWQVITLQQASGDSGMIVTYNEDIDFLTNYINSNKTGDALLGWHMTWAYQQNAKHPQFPNYDNDQQTMYEKIVSCVNEKIDTNTDFDFVIPAGTAIQNARTSYIGDALTYDGFHLNALGEFIVGVTWALKITGWPIEDLDFGKIPPEFQSYAEAIKEAAANAIEKPYEVTQSKFTAKPAEPSV